MSSYKDSLSQYTDLLDSNGQLLAASTPALLHPVQARGREMLRTFATEARDTEADYAATRLDTLFAPDYGVNLGRMAMGADVAASFRCGIPRLNSLLAVVANDTFHATDTLVRNMPEGLTVCSLRNVPGNMQADAAAMLAATPATPATALADALIADGTYIRVEAGVQVEKPVQIVNIFSSETPMLTPRRVLVHAMPGSHVRVLLCDHTQSASTPHLNLQIVQIAVEDGASVELYDIEESGAATRRYNLVYATQADGSRLVLNNTTLTCGVSRNDYRVEVPGNHAETSMSGLAIASQEQVCETRVTLHHTGTRCTSRQLFKNAIFDNASGAFGGRIVVDESARYTDAAQTNRNILQSDKARMAAAPQLEIYCDEVKCSHGATTGQLDERALFYMQTRGIPRDEAQRMLTQAFMVDVIDNISFEVLRQRLHALVEKRLSGATADCSACASACHTPHPTEQ